MDTTPVRGPFHVRGRQADYNYRYFEKLHETGYISIHNHTVSHPLNLPGLPAAQQLNEISGLRYQTAAHRLRPGDVILGRFRGPAQLRGATMVRMMTRLYRHI